MLKPEISVIVPVYNAKEEYLRKAVESILSQTYTDFEFLIVDDCSKEYVEHIVKSYDDKRIKYFRLDKNQGAAAARNFAIKQAKGKYLAFMDSDDISLPERFQKQYDFLETHEEIGCLGTQVSIIGDYTCKAMSFPKPVTHDEIQAHLLFFGNIFCQSSVMLRKEILEKNKIAYHSEYVPAEDYALWLDLVGYTKFHVLGENLVTYRFYEENVSNRQKEKQAESRVNAQFATWKRFLDIKEFDKELWKKFLVCRLLTDEDVIKLNEQLQQIIDGFVERGYPRKDIMYFFRKRFKKQYYKTKTLKGQLALWKSPLNEVFRISLFFRLFCFITRGIL